MHNEFIYVCIYVCMAYTLFIYAPPLLAPRASIFYMLFVYFYHQNCENFSNTFRSISSKSYSIYSSSTLKTKNFGQLRFRTSVCPKFQWLWPWCWWWVICAKNRCFISQSIFNRTKFNLNDRCIGDNPLKLNFGLRIICPKSNCPKFLVFNIGHVLEISGWLGSLIVRNRTWTSHFEKFTVSVNSKRAQAKHHTWASILKNGQAPPRSDKSSWFL